MRGGYGWIAALLVLGGCAGSGGSVLSADSYQALGHDPAWILTIRDGSLTFVGTPKTRIQVAAPVPQPLPYGHRYSTERLTVEITVQPCNDSESGIAFSDTIVVLVDGVRHVGCGGERVPLLNI